MSTVLAVLEKYQRKEACLIAMLQDIQKAKGYLPEQDLRVIAREVRVPLSRLYSIATFYRAFSLAPRGRHHVQVCLGTACHVRGGARLAARLEHEFNIRSGETTHDRRFTLEAVRCVGCCGLAPVAVIDGRFHGKLNQSQLMKILDRYE